MRVYESAITLVSCVHAFKIKSYRIHEDFDS